MRSPSTTPPSSLSPGAFRALAHMASAALLVLLMPGVVCAEVWGMGQFQNRGVDPNAVATFRDLLRDEVTAALGVRFVDVPGECADVQCVRTAAGGTGAEAVVHGSVGRLGDKVVVSVNVAEVGTGTVRFSERMNSAGVEELDVVAKRMAAAIAAQKPVEKTAELGNITHAEAQVPRRRRGRNAASLGLQGILPLHGYADRVGGGGIELGYWFETYDIAIEPHFGLRFDMGDEERDFFHLPLELGASWLVSRGDISPTIGVGGGMHFVWESVSETTRTRGVIVDEAVSRSRDDFAALFAAYGRVGLLLMRTYTVSLHVSLDFVYGFGRFEERGEDGESAMRVNVHVIMGDD